MEKTVTEEKISIWPPLWNTIRTSFEKQDLSP